MYLESIELFGFKTFVSNTKIFLAPHINCIVGPNGAGKSNIVDAVRWMLGEQRLSSLRAIDSTDLIFSGSSMKK
ncbi:MAG: AAA family ATPase, partial [Caldiserica bacterium]|nr:AAA family ATPase [Caldisericota bacterium]